MRVISIKTCEKQNERMRQSNVSKKDHKLFCCYPVRQQSPKAFFILQEGVFLLQTSSLICGMKY